MTAATATDSARMMAAALLYAKWGWPVFPLHTPVGNGCSCASPQCGNPGKHPRTRNGFKDASTDPATITQWWTDWPGANVGLVTGPASGLLVLDVDPRNRGDETLDELIRQVGRLPDTPEVMTGGGGRHFFFRWDDALATCRKGLGAGLDVKGAGGYVVAAPSLHASGRHYGWEASGHPADVPLADLPTSLLAMLSSGRDSSSHAPTKGDAMDSLLGQAFKAASMLGRPLGAGKYSVECPWDHLHTSGSRFDSSTAIFPAKEGSGVGGFVCLHSHCDGRTYKDVLDALPREAVIAARRLVPGAKPALRVVTEAPAPSQPEVMVTSWEDQLIYDKKGRPLACGANVALVLRLDPTWAGVYGWDLFASQITVRRAPPWGTESAGLEPASQLGQLTDEHISRTSYAITRQWGWQVGEPQVQAAIRVAAQAHPFHPVRDYLDSLEWDGVLRLDTWLSAYLGAEQSPYTADVGRTFLIGAVARVMRPGCKLDTMLILEGTQGAGKSTAISALFGKDWTLDTPLDLGSKDRFSALRGKWAVEHAELDSLGRHDKERVKAFISSAFDEYRPSYARTEVRQPRQCVFVGTTNQEAYLDDETGNRRFNGVRILRIDREALERDKPMLWAEAREAFISGAEWWPDAALVEQYRLEQGARRKRDEWEALVLDYITHKPRVTVSDILQNKLNLEAAKWTTQDQNRIRRALTSLGWTQRREREAGERVRYYYPPTEGA